MAAIEFKSQVGSFGNNFNNRTEEALGNAVDVWRAYEEGTFGPIRPWLGFVFLLEEAEKSTKPVRLAKTVFPVEPIFENTSYKDRYQILCQRIVRERLYDAACFVTSSSDPDAPVDQPLEELGLTTSWRPSPAVLPISTRSGCARRAERLANKNNREAPRHPPGSLDKVSGDDHLAA